MNDPELWRATPDGLEVLLKVTPKAKRNHIVGFTPQGLKIQITAAPEKGHANEAVLALLAKACGLAKRDAILLAGDTSPVKRILLKGDATALLGMLQGNRHD